MLRAYFTKWIQAPPITGYYALACGVVAVAIPTLERAAVSGAISGCEFTPYLPFVLISALLLRWWKAAGVALVSVAIMGGLLGGHIHDIPCFASSAGMFIAASVIMIAVVALIRTSVEAIHNRGADESNGGIIFSLEEDQVWASWYGQGPPVLLGSQGKVARMMEDFLAQVELGKRLNRPR